MNEDLIRLTCELTQEPEFPHKELKEFTKLINKPCLCHTDLIQNSIIQHCMQQGCFSSLREYINSDNTLKIFMKKQDKKATKL